MIHRLKQVYALVVERFSIFARLFRELLCEIEEGTWLQIWKTN
jgi:hypothetical protein